MVFDGSKESCPNYNSDTGELDMSYEEFINPFSPSLGDPEYGKENFNKTCFNICATKNEDGSDKGPTYIMNGRCNTCLDEEGSTRNPSTGTRNYLINSGLYEMCNIPESIL